MARKAFKNRDCQTCSADIRPGALFCYACGAAVAPALPGVFGESSNTGTSGRLRENSGGSKGQTGNSAGQSGGEDFQTKIPGISAIRKPDTDFNEDYKSQPKIDLKPALPRRENKAAPQETVKIVWEAPEDSPNIWFLIVSLVLVLFAVGILLAMLTVG